MESDVIRTVAVVGCGTVGASWAALFLSGGYNVIATDPGAGVEQKLKAFIDHATPQLAETGLIGQGTLTFVASLEEAVADADLIQENATENETFKRELLARIDRASRPDAIVAISTSALLRSRIVADCCRRERHIVAHPFNPPHLLPLVEIVGEDEGVVARACEFYRSLRRKPVVLNKEMSGHIANRLASALYREAVYLVEQGVASVADIDAAMCNGPGLRWAIMGPHMTYHLGGGPGGIEHYLAHLGPSQVSRWASLGSPTFGPEVQKQIVEGIVAEAGGRSVPELEARRDRALLEILRTRIEVAGES